MFLGLRHGGINSGSALVVKRTVVPMELGKLSYKDGTIEDYLGREGLKKLGRKTWEKLLAGVAMRLSAAIHLDDLVVGGGNAKKLTYLPTGCRVGSNANAFLGGFRMWKDEELRRAATPPVNTRTSPPTTSQINPRANTHINPSATAIRINKEARKT